MERRKARQVAMQVLYQLEIAGGSLDDILAARRKIEPQPPPEFAMTIVNGVLADRHHLDALIQKYADNWALERMPVVDRNILRICLYEMLHEPDIPFSVSINEAVELAKTFGGRDSGKFVNGLVARAAQLMEKAGK